jgi:tRNA(His) 5'-end guanylyltransferase
MTEDFGDRMKMLEQVEAGRRLMPLLPIIARLDGKGFSRYTADLERPFDRRLSDSMVDATRYLVEEVDGARIGYTQSDEISLVIYSETYERQVFFDAKVQKLTSVLASMLTGVFNDMMKDLRESGDVPGRAVFDCRVWSVPTRVEAANALLWREQDATKNSISMAARHYYSHRELQDKKGGEMQEMLFQKGINWDKYPDFFKRGTFVQRRKVVRPLTNIERARIPDKFRPPEGQAVERSEVRVLPMPPFAKVTNREAVVFDGEEPLTLADKPLGLGALGYVVEDLPGGKWVLKKK